MSSGSCWLCVEERHYCQGCGLTLEHGETKCYDCARRSLEVVDSSLPGTSDSEWQIRWEQTKQNG